MLQGWCISRFVEEHEDGGGAEWLSGQDGQQLDAGGCHLVDVCRIHHELGRDMTAQ